MGGISPGQLLTAAAVHSSMTVAIVSWVSRVSHAASRDHPGIVGQIFKCGTLNKISNLLKIKNVLI